MNRLLGWGILFVFFAGCRAVPIKKTSSTGLADRPFQHQEVSQDQPTRVRQSSHKDEGDTLPGASLVRLANESTEWMDAATGTLAEYEKLALIKSPAIAEIDAELEALKGKRLQSVLPPNPVAGINGEDINEDGEAGRYGVFFGRQIVRGNKLGLSGEVVCAEIQTAIGRREIVAQRVLTDVRQAFFQLLIVQERIATIEQLVEISQQAVDTSTRLLEAAEIAQTSLLQAELELQNAKVLLRQAMNQKRGASRQLAALVGMAELPANSVRGDIHSLPQLDPFESFYDQLIQVSPEINALYAEVEQRRRSLVRQIADPIPNVTWQSTLQFDTVTDDVIAGFQIGMPIPTLNQNQGAIHQARNEIIRTERQAEKKALDLRQKLALAYQGYLDARIQVEAFEQEIIPKASKTVQLISAAYREGELPFLQWLTAQRTYSQTQLTYLGQLQTLWDRHWAVRGMLLSGSLQDDR